jgi:putative spermidine/putrescine transport system substrate-binding protein
MNMRSRRTIVAVLVAIGVTTASSLAVASTNGSKSSSPLSTHRSAASTITIAAWGGAYGAAEKAAYFDPFTKATGIHIKALPAEPTLGPVKLQVKNHNVIWDVAELAGPDTLVGCKQNLLVKINYKSINRRLIAPGGSFACGIVSSIFSQGIAYDKTKINHPPTWRDFFDVKTFPGKRGIEDFVEDGVFENALLGAGVAKSKLYPINFDLAIKTLRSLGGNVDFASFSQLAQLLASHDLVMTQMSVGRWFPLHKADANIGYVSNGIRAPSIFAIPKGAKHLAQAQRFMQFIATCVRCSKTMAVMAAYAGPNAKGDRQPPARIRNLLPSSPNIIKTTWAQNLAWWAANDALANTKYQTFRAGG